jgi:hypothetical protein
LSRCINSLAAANGCVIRSIQKNGEYYIATKSKREKKKEKREKERERERERERKREREGTIDEYVGDKLQSNPS